MYRYAEGAGTATRFDVIKDIDFLSSTQLICTDFNNYCLRLVDFTLSPPETSRFAGDCRLSGVTDGHRLNSALFDRPRNTAVNSNKSVLFTLSYLKTLRMIDLKTDTVTTIATLHSDNGDIKFIGDNLLYFARHYRVSVLNINSGEERIVAGGDSRGNAVGSFEQTEFGAAYGLLLMRNKVNTLLLVADASYDRFVGCYKMYLLAGHSLLILVFC